MFEWLNQTQEVVKTAVREQNPTVYKTLVQSLVQEEINERIDLVTKAMGVLKMRSKELNGLRPDSKLMDQEGKVIQEGFTQDQFNKRKKLVETVNNLEKALSEAINDANYENLKKVLGNMPKETNVNN